MSTTLPSVLRGGASAFRIPRTTGGEEGAPAYHSVADIRNLLKSGEYELANEYGERFGADSLKEFEELCEWRGGAAYDGKPLGTYPQDEAPWDHEPGATGYRDPEGYAFDSQYFR